MNRRLPEKEINATRERYADDGLFRAVDSVGRKLEKSTPKFGIRTEEAYVYTLNLLAKIARQGYGARYTVDELWDAEYVECRRLTRKPEEDESRKVVGIVFVLAARAMLSSADGFYNIELTRLFTEAVHNNAFEGRDELLKLILFGIAVPEGWMDEFLVRVKADPSATSATAATSAASAPSAGDEELSLTQTNTVFSRNLFGSEEKLARVREVILQSFAADGEDASGGKFDPSVQADWYTVLRAIVEAGVTRRNAKISDRGFLRQMLAWLPELFLREEGETKKETVNRYARSLSKERKIWVEGTERKKVPIKDLCDFARNRVGDAKTERLFAAAKGLKRRLEELKDDLRKEAGA